MSTLQFKSLKQPPELAWNELDKRVKKKKNEKELLESLKKRMESIIRLILWETFAKDCAMVIKAKGAYFDESKI